MNTENELKHLREQNKHLHHLMLVYIIEIQKANKGIRRLKRRLEKTGTVDTPSNKGQKWTPNPTWVIVFWAICVSNEWMHSMIVLMVGFGTLFFERLKVKNIS